MGKVMPQFKGRAEGGTINAIVREELAKNTRESWTATPSLSGLCHLKTRMNAHALSVLEFPRVLDVVAGLPRRRSAATRVRALEPTTDATWLEREHARVAAMRAAIEGDEPWHPDPIPDLADGARAAAGHRQRVESALELLAGGHAAALVAPDASRAARLQAPRRSCARCSRRSSIVLVAAQAFEDRDRANRSSTTAR